MSKRDAKTKIKILRPPAALLRFYRAVGIVFSLWLIMSYGAIPSVISNAERKMFSGLGPPHVPLDKVFCLFVWWRAKAMRSENALIEILKFQEQMLRDAGIKLKRKKVCKKSPHNSLLSRFKLRITNVNLKLAFKELVMFAKEQGILQGKIVVIDSVPVELCRICKNRRRCEYLKTGGKVPKDCLKYSYENAECGHKREDERFVGWKLHCIIDYYTGLILACILTPANVHDSSVAIPLLKMIKRMGFEPTYVLGDAAYYSKSIKKYIFKDLKAKPIVDYNPGNTIAQWFTIKTKNDTLRITPTGTPLCLAGHEMTYVDTNENGSCEWECPKIFKPEHMENGTCLYNPKHNCKQFTYVEDDYLHLNDPPTVSHEWKTLASLRKNCEYPFSHLVTNLNLGIINYRQSEGLEFSIYLTPITLIVIALMAHKFGIRENVRTIDEVMVAIRDFLNGSKEFRRPWHRITKDPPGEHRPFTIEIIEHGPDNSPAID